jgi:putative addiction module component (TIGR02574 family)
MKEHPHGLAHLPRESFRVRLNDAERGGFLRNDSAPCYNPLMSRRADKLFEDAQALPAEERAILALQLLDSVGEPETEIERAWRDEVRQRLTDIDAGRAKLTPWDEARGRIFSRE